jgi:hypothetical protein
MRIKNLIMKVLWEIENEVRKMKQEARKMNVFSENEKLGERL